MQLQLKTTTPFWTGDIRTETQPFPQGSGLRETTLMGSLRWWYEAMVRGMGLWACDPTKHECGDSDLCVACRAFGATGMGRKFRIRVHDHTRGRGPYGSIQISVPKTKKPPRWYFKGGLMGNFDLDVIPLRSRFPVEAVAGLLAFLSKNAGWGAKTQLGYGLFEFRGEAPSLDPLMAHLGALSGPGGGPGRPDLREMFFATFEDERNRWRNDPNENAKPMLEFKYYLREQFRPGSGKAIAARVKGAGVLKKLRHELLGTVAGDRRGSKVFISQPYRDGNRTLIRLWGWIPDDLPGGIPRDDIISEVRNTAASQFGPAVRWRELGNPLGRCGTCTAICHDGLEFLRCCAT